MAKYKNPITGEVIEVGAPELNPELIKGKVVVPETTPLGITSDSLQPATPIGYYTYADKPIDVSNLTLTPEQQKTQTSTEELQKLISGLAGETTYKTGLEQEKDIEGLTKITTEQATIVKNLQLEAQRLANQYAGVEDVMQAGAEGRGITAGGLAPLTAAEQRKIAIQQRNVASQALTAYAAYNTAAGNLQIAQDAIDRAVKAKYDPLKEEISIKKQNLELLLGSPLATAQEKALAQAQLKKQEAEEKKVDEQEGFFKSIQKMYVELAAISTANPVDVSTIRKLLNKKEFTVDDVAEATRLFAKNQPTEIKAPTTREVGGALYQWDEKTGTWKQVVAGKPEEIYAPNIPGLTKSQARDVYSLATSPDWFRQGMEQELKMSILPDKLQALWNTAQGKYKEKGIMGATETKETEEGELKFEDF